MSTAQNQNNLKAQNKKVIFLITFVGMLMLSLSYAAVPLYDIFCRVTGFGGTTQIASSAVNVFGANTSLNQILARTGGKILNPNMELLFNNVTLRTFNFSFKMTPRDENEATQVKSIIRSLKKNMSAKLGTSAN